VSQMLAQLGSGGGVVVVQNTALKLRSLLVPLSSPLLSGSTFELLEIAELDTLLLEELLIELIILESDEFRDEDDM